MRPGFRSEGVLEDESVCSLAISNSSPIHSLAKCVARRRTSVGEADRASLLYLHIGQSVSIWSQIGDRQGTYSNSYVRARSGLVISHAFGTSVPEDWSHASKSSFLAIVISQSSTIEVRPSRRLRHLSMTKACQNKLDLIRRVPGFSSAHSALWNPPSWQS